MTPAINDLKKRKISFTLHKYIHDPAHQSYGLEAAEKLNLDPERVLKTLVVQLDTDELGVAIVPVTRQLNMKALAKFFGVKKIFMAEATLVEKSTGYVLGGVSPLAQKKRLKTVLDSSAEKYQTIFVSGGRRGLEIELKPTDLLRLTGAATAAVS